jgi:hypothetical protein
LKSLSRNLRGGAAHAAVDVFFNIGLPILNRAPLNEAGTVTAATPISERPGRYAEKLGDLLLRQKIGDHLISSSGVNDDEETTVLREPVVSAIKGLTFFSAADASPH